MGNKLSTLPLSLKVIATCFVLAVGIGYGVAMLQVFNRTGLEVGKTVIHYRGSPDDATMSVPQSYPTMLSITHVHSFSQPLVIGLVAFLFALTHLAERSKIFWTLVSFLGSLTSNAGPWLIRYGAPQFVSLLYFSGSAMILGFLVMAFFVLGDLWKGEG